MRTTIDLPDDVLRRAKADAALRGMSLKDWFTRAVRTALGEGVTVVAESPPTWSSEEQVLSEDLVLPLIRGEGGPALKGLTPARVHEILEDEEVQRARDSAR